MLTRANLFTNQFVNFSLTDCIVQNGIVFATGPVRTPDFKVYNINCDSLGDNSDVRIAMKSDLTGANLILMKPLLSQ